MAQSAVAARRAANLMVNQENPKSSLKTPSVSDTTPLEHQARSKIPEPRRKRRKLDDKLFSDDGLSKSAGLDIEQEETARAVLEADNLAKAEQADTVSTDKEKHDPSPATIVNSTLTVASFGLKLCNDLTWNDSYDTVEAKLKPGEVVLAAGEYDLWIKKGTIRIQGAVIHASSKTYRVLCSVSQAVPPIEALLNPFGPSIQDVEICISSCSSGLRQLQRLDPKFSRIWPHGGGTLASFEILRSEDEARIRLLELQSIWQTQVNNLLESDKLPVVMICGPKNSGKSTFSRFLSNSFLSRKYANAGLAYLDLDPGQPEYSSPADLSLLHIKKFNLSPPFAHPILVGGNQGETVRQHHYGYFSPRGDPQHYLRCASDLYHRYSSQMKHLGSPLIVNTCGWTQGAGLDLLDSLTQIVRPSHVVLIASPEADEIATNLRQGEVELLTLPSISTIAGPNSSAYLRSMQQCSYFHVEDIEEQQIHWNSKTVFTSESLEVSYAGDNRVISAVFLLGDHIDFDLLGEAIDKTILALVAVEDSSSLFNALNVLSSDVDPHETGLEDDIADEHMHVEQESTEELHIEDSDSLSERNSTYVLKMNSRGLPFLSTQGDINPPLDPARTRSLGQVLLSSIDHDQQVFRIHTPISLKTITKCIEQGTKLILVRGQLGMPEWAYLEEYNLMKAMQEDIAMLKELKQVDASKDTLEFDVSAWAQRTPYVEHLDPQASKSKGKVRRLRRNFGK